MITPQWDVPTAVSRSCLRNQQVIHFSSISWTPYRGLFKIHFSFWKRTPWRQVPHTPTAPFLIPSTSHRTSWKACLCLSLSTLSSSISRSLFSWASSLQIPLLPWHYICPNEEQKPPRAKSSQPFESDLELLNSGLGSFSIFLLRSPQHFTPKDQTSSSKYYHSFQTLPGQIYPFLGLQTARS